MDAPEKTEADRLVDFLHGAGPNEDGLWFHEAAQRKEYVHWWRVYLRRLERIHAAELDRLRGENERLREAVAHADRLAESVRSCLDRDETTKAKKGMFGLVLLLNNAARAAAKGETP